MFGIRHYQAEPSTWVRLVRDGRVVREGVGLSVWLWGTGSTMIAVPCGLRELRFVGSGEVGGIHGLTAEGRVVWQIADPESAAARLDFRLEGDGLARAESFLHSELKGALREVQAEKPTAGEVSREALAALRVSALLGSLGVHALAVHVDVLRDCLLGGTAHAPADPVVVSDVSPSHPLASAWRRELALAARFGPRFPRGVA